MPKSELSKLTIRCLYWRYYQKGKRHYFTSIQEESYESENEGRFVVLWGEGDIKGVVTYQSGQAKPQWQFDTDERRVQAVTYAIRYVNAMHTSRVKEGWAEVQVGDHSISTPGRCDDWWRHQGVVDLTTKTDNAPDWWPRSDGSVMQRPHKAVAFKGKARAFGKSYGASEKVIKAAEYDESKKLDLDEMIELSKKRAKKEKAHVATIRIGRFNIVKE